MKACAKCAAVYSEDFTHCPRDGTPLTPYEPWATGSVVRDKYRIVGVIGSGGMATVYKAEHVHFHEWRALKVINADLAADLGFVKRFMQEAILTRRLQHPHAVRVDDIEKAEDGRPFMVMEFIDGEQLIDLMLEGPIDLKTAATIAEQIAEALGAAHELGMVHRDIKPGNIVLKRTAPGVYVKVLDFGIAKVKASHVSSNPITHAPLTGVGSVIGTPSYMSPEQAAGTSDAEVDGRADIYSLGIVFYQMLTGRLPLTANSEVELLAAQINTPPTPIHLLRPDLPTAVCELIMMCLAKQREARPKNCDDFIVRLHAALKENAGSLNATAATVVMPAVPPQPAPPPSPPLLDEVVASQLAPAKPWIRKKAAFVAVGAMLALAAVGFALMRHSSPPAPTTTRPQPAPFTASAPTLPTTVPTPAPPKPPAVTARKSPHPGNRSAAMDITGPQSPTTPDGRQMAPAPRPAAKGKAKSKRTKRPAEIDFQ